VLHGELKAWCDKKQLSAHVSLSDESDYATSYVIVEQAEP
jgi:phosphopantetheinyl transferase (holo-ACP synthase)